MSLWFYNCIMSVIEILRKFFGLVDTKKRKRHSSISCSSTPTKKQCLNYSKMNNDSRYLSKMELQDFNGHHYNHNDDDDDDDDDDIQICREIKFHENCIFSNNGCTSSDNCKSKFLKYYPTKQRPIQDATCKNLGFTAIQNNFSNLSNNKNNTIESNRYYQYSKNDLESLKHSTINETYRLREKAEYGKLLKNFLPPKTIVTKSCPEKIKNTKKIQVINLDDDDDDDDDYEDDDESRVKLSQIYISKPHTKIKPVKWSTPLNKPLKSLINQHKNTFIEEIKIDDSDSENSNQPANRNFKLQSISSPSKSIQSCEIKTNSLRDQLSTKQVFKGDYIERINGRFNQRFEQKCKEVEEVKVVAQILNKKNRYNRSTSLENQLSQSLKLYVPILEEDYEQEFKLPELTELMLEQVKKALIPRPADQVLVDAFGLSVRRKDIATLSGLNWLNDEVINFYMNLLIDRSGKNNLPTVHAMNTFFYPKLLSGGHASLKRWTRKIDIFSKDIVTVPIHLGMHWCMAIIDFRDKSIRYYDSMGGQNQKCLNILKEYLEKESLDKKKIVFDTSDWILECMKGIPQQMNGSDCGVFSCTFAEFICSNKKLNFSQDNMPYFRKKMVYEILHAKLL